jgi:hypothetical protein
MDDVAINNADDTIMIGGWAGIVKVCTLHSSGIGCEDSSAICGIRDWNREWRMEGLL